MVFAIKSAVWYLVVMVTIDDDGGGGWLVWWRHCYVAYSSHAKHQCVKSHNFIFQLILHFQL